MDVIIVMCIGVLIGRLFVPNRAKKGNELVSLACTFFLIFSMGVKLGKNEHFFEDLSSLGLSSLLFFLVPTVCSIIIVFILTKKFMKKKASDPGKEVEQ